VVYSSPSRAGALVASAAAILAGQPPAARGARRRWAERPARAASLALSFLGILRVPLEKLCHFFSARGVRTLRARWRTPSRISFIEPACMASLLFF
jgi:hypothetical protein